MPLESATYLNTLVATNPAHDDSLGQMDAHLRMIKGTLQATFPALTAPVLSTAAQIDANRTTPGRLAVLEANMNVMTGDQVFPGSLSVATKFSASAIYQGFYQLLPSGCVVMWAGSDAAIPGGWAVCDGTKGTPDMRERFIVAAGLSYPQGTVGGNNAVSAATSTAGVHNHAGTTDVGGAHGHGIAMSIAGDHGHTGNTAGHVLTVAEMPSHGHTVPLSSPTYGNAGGGGYLVTPGGPGSYGTSSAGSDLPHAHGIVNDGSHVHPIALDPVGNHQHLISPDGAHAHTVAFDNRPKFFAILFIMKLA